VKVGDVSLDAEKLAANCKTVIGTANVQFAKTGAQIESISLRYTDSPSLEVYRREITAEEDAEYKAAGLYKRQRRRRERTEKDGEEKEETEGDKKEETAQDDDDSSDDEEAKKPKTLALFKGTKKEASLAPPKKKKAKTA
jgi:hypothetical protein